jgi:hypothetical protein
VWVPVKDAPSKRYLLAQEMAAGALAGGHAEKACGLDVQWHVVACPRRQVCDSAT